MSFVTFLLVLFITSSFSQGSNDLEENDDDTELDALDQRSGKQYWPYIGLVRFANSDCSSLEGYVGVCVTRRECGYIDGIQSGSCVSNGIGRCCLVYRTCGQTSAYNNTYFVSDDFPNTFNDEISCTFTIEPCPGSTCQARIDFLNFVLAQPDGNGNCVDDAMVITGSGGNIPIICGQNSGQHIYLTFVGNNSITVTISTSSSADIERSWNLKVTHIACDCPTLAPPGCLQYYTDLSGTVRSFNYGTEINGAVVTTTTGTFAGTRQLANTNYGICIYMQPGYCSIQWSQSSDSTSFTVTGDTALIEASLGLPSTPVIGDSCTTDFVVIPNPYYTTGTAVGTDRFCGNQFDTVYTFSKPFVLTVVTDADEVTTSTDVANRGFSLSYTQQSCRNVNAALLLTG
ncbi:uncharacterized protein LOC143203671 [Rhynchophorus ferrugineus]|uniref:uncharacterized protein LOC143203671 n=1 Tax=Rhynchophorus ferrugineus TaxID=354439 RepID=UPI003FCD484E